MVADDYGIWWIIASEQYKFTWLIRMVNLAIVYLLTNVFMKKNSQNYCISLRWTTKYSNILCNSKKKIFV